MAATTDILSNRVKLRRGPIVRSAYSAFTLIELLVVVAIIAILASLLFPALSSAKYQAGNARCKSNLRQISLALQIYVSTYNAFVPFYEPAVSEDQWTSFKAAPWETRLNLDAREMTVPDANPPWGDPAAKDYPILGGVFRCPLNKGQIFTWQGVERCYSPYNSYGYNAFGAGDGTNFLGLGGGSLVPLWQRRIGKASVRTTLESEVARPAEMLALGDAFLRSIREDYDGTLSIDGGVGTGTRIAPSSNTGGAVVAYLQGDNQLKKQPYFRTHRGRANRALVDGHIESEDMRAQFQGTDAELRRWNGDYLPHRDVLQP